MTAESKHTPGPWLAVGTTPRVQIMKADTGDVIAFVPHNMPRVEFEANARLIAEAPELLSIAKRWTALGGSSWHPERYSSEKAELLTDTCAAIAKATGRAA